MKTQRFFMALAAVAALSLGSCTQEEELLVSGNTYDSLNDPNAVLFGTYASQAPQSRGSVITTDAMKDKDFSGFGVYAYYTQTADFATDGTNAFAPNFMCNQQVKWDAAAKYPANDGEDVNPGMWVYSPVKYWPDKADEKVSFFAYAPYTTVAKANAADYGITSVPDNTITGDPKIGYTLSEKPGEQIDLLYADAMPNLIKQDVTDRVQFNFNHAMTRIGFERVIEIDEINPDKNTGYDTETQAEYSLAEGTTVTIKKVTLASTKFNKSGELNLCTGKWDNLSDGFQYYTLEDSDLGDGKTATIKDSKERVQLNADDKYLMTLPSDEEIPVDITVVFDVTTEDLKLPGGKSQITSEVTTSFNYKFVEGKWYNFVLHISLTSVKLDAVVQTWNDILDENVDKQTKAEVVVNTPYSNSVSLIYDANGGRFYNGSSQYIITSYVGNFTEDDKDAAGHNPQNEAKFNIRNFLNEGEGSPENEIIWIPTEDLLEYQLEGWTDEKTNHESEDYMWDNHKTIHYSGDPIFVEKTDNKTSRTIYGWWPQSSGM